MGSVWGGEFQPWACLPTDTVPALPLSALYLRGWPLQAAFPRFAYQLTSASLRQQMEPPLGHEGVGSQAIAPHSSFQKQLHLFCVCSPRSH